MADFLDYMDGAAGGGVARLEEMRLNEEPTMALAFTRDGDTCRLHYEKDESVGSYVLCPGPGCPLCALGMRPREYFLMPLLDVETTSVKVLRIAVRRGPTTLFDQLKPHIKADKPTDRLLLLVRVNSKYSVTSEPLAPGADRGTAAIERYLKDRKEGLDLTAAFTRMTAEELCGVERIRKLLEARGINPTGTSAE